MEVTSLTCVLFFFFKEVKIGHREVTSETLLPIILEVGTLGHILLKDKFQLPRDYWTESLSHGSLLLFQKGKEEVTVRSSSTEVEN